MEILLGKALKKVKLGLFVEPHLTPPLLAPKTCALLSGDFFIV